MSHLQMLLRDLLLMKVNKDSDIIYNQDIKDDLLNIQNKYDEVNLLTKLTLVEEILKRLNSNADIKLILQKFILDWQNK